MPPSWSKGRTELSSQPWEVKDVLPQRSLAGACCGKMSSCLLLWLLSKLGTGLGWVQHVLINPELLTAAQMQLCCPIFNVG